MRLVYLLPLLLLVINPAFAHIAFQPVYQPSVPASGEGPAEKYCSLGDFLNSYNSTTHIFTCLTATSSAKVFNQTAQNDFQVTGINNVTGVITTNQFSVNTESCGSNFVSGIDNVTGFVTCTAVVASSLKVFNQTALPDFQVTGINNVTGVITTNQFSINSNTCTNGDFVSSLDNATGFIICGTPSSSGFTKIVSAPATTAKIIADNSTISNTAEFKTLTQSTGITITNNTSEIVIATTAGAFKNPLLDGSNHTDTEADAVTRGDMIVGTSASLWGELPIGASGTVLKSDGTDPSWGTVATPTVLAANVTASDPNGSVLVWSIALTANSGNIITGVLSASSNTANAAVQAGANVTNANSKGWCLWETPTAATTNSIDFLVLGTGNVVDTGETTWLPAIEVSQPIMFNCAITTGSTAGNLKIVVSPEVAATASIKAGSFYIKTP